MREVKNRSRKSLCTRGVVQGDTVEHHDAGLRLTTVHVRASNVSRTTYHARQQRSEVCRGANRSGYQQRNLANHLRVDAATKFGIFEIQRGGIGADFNPLGGALKLQLNVLANRVTDTDKNAVLHIITKTLRLHRQLVSARQNILERVEAIGV